MPRATAAELRSEAIVIDAVCPLASRLLRNTVLWTALQRHHCPQDLHTSGRRHRYGPRARRHVRRAHRRRPIRAADPAHRTGPDRDRAANRCFRPQPRLCHTLVPPAACTYWDQAEQALWRDVDLVPIAKRPTYHYLKNARAEAWGYNLPVATSIRILR